MISKSGKYMLNALVLLALLPKDEYMGAGAIAEKIKAPGNYLGKLLQALSRKGILESRQGLGGGFRLLKLPGKITLFSVLDKIDTMESWESCFLGRETCSNSSPCAAHKKWAKVYATYMSFLKETTLEDICEH